MAKLADPGLLDKIDKLFECNVGHYIDLPQLVVVGDQSSGKSSVLQGLTNLPFPRDSGLCTRFATQIIFRRAAKERVSIRIIPAKGADPEHAARIRAWSKQGLKNLDQNTFGNIMHEVHSVMGISQGETLSGQAAPKTFSDDVLLLEVCGPNEEHLSVIDVPGIFKKTTQGVTTQADMLMVQSMVEGYVRNPRSVILAVVPANVDTATQSILDMAEKHDPDGIRTLGVLTKPDLVDSGAENRVMDLLESQKESDDNKDRHAVEKNFFRTTAPWNQVNEDQVGVEALQTRLRDLLGTLTRREFPKVRAELNKMLKDKKLALEALGSKRDTFEEQATYLTKVASQFQSLAANAVKANYSANSKFEQDPVLKIATLFVGRNEILSSDFANYGHKFQYNSKVNGSLFKPAIGTVDQVVPTDKDSDEGAEDGTYIRQIDVAESYPEIEDMLTEDILLPPPEPNVISQWLAKLHKSSRGLEIGTFDPGLLTVAMQAQSERWENLAYGYVSDIIAYTHDFVVRLIYAICPDERVSSGLVSFLTDRLTQKYERAMGQAKFILHVERSNTPLTMNHYFNDNLEKCRQHRLRDALKDKVVKSQGSSLELVNLNAVIQTSNMSNEENLIQHLHDILQSYYKVARKRIVDVLCMQAASYHLLTGPDTPLTILTPEFIRTISVEDMESIAGENPILIRKRQDLIKAIKDLEMGKRILM